MHRTTVVRRVTLSGLAAAGLVALGATSAMAHVTINPSTTAAGATAVLRLEIPHGCEASATTALSVRIPEEVTDATAPGTDRWAVDQAADSLTWTTDDPLPDGERAEIEFSVRLPDDAGATLVFPVVQRCVEGEVAWTEVAEHDEGHDALERPAPVLVVTPGDPGAANETAGGEPSATPEPETSDEAAVADAPSATAVAEVPSATAVAEVAGTAATAEAQDPLITYGAAGLLAAGVLAAGAVLLRRRRRP